MRIYIVGSFPRDYDDQQREIFRDACKSIGKHFASIGVEFVLGASAPTTADHYVVTGIQDYLTENPGKMATLHFVVDEKRKSDAAYLDISQLPSELFIVKKIPVKGANNHGRLISGLRHSDTTLLLGGGSGTLTTGIAAVAMKHPVLALPQFGGAAEQIWQILVSHYARGPFSQDDIDIASASWDDDSPKVTANCLDKIRKVNPFIERIEIHQIGLSIIAILCITLWIYLFYSSEGESLSYTRFFAVSGLATILGCTARNIVRCYFDVEIRFSLGRFVTELVLGMVVVFALFLALQIGGIVVSGETMALVDADPQKFRRITIAMSLVGFSASYLIESSLERLRSRLTHLLDDFSKT